MVAGVVMGLGVVMVGVRGVVVISLGHQRPGAVMGGLDRGGKRQRKQQNQAKRPFDAETGHDRPHSLPFGDGFPLLFFSRFAGR